MSIDTLPAAQAIEALIQQYGRLVFRVIYGLTGDWHESQDLTQDTFIQAFKAIEAARQASGANFHAKAWLLRIAANNARMSCRRRRLVRFVPFSRLREEEHEESEGELMGERPAPVQPAGYGMGNMAEDPAAIIAEQECGWARAGTASRDTAVLPAVVNRGRVVLARNRAGTRSE
jgi:RNA polymerase sigma factor (sigma-70 family)